MIIAAIYPVVLFLLVFRLRRTWGGYALAVGGTVLLWLIGSGVARIVGAKLGEVFALLVYGEMVLVGVVCFWLVTLRRRLRGPAECPGCGYDTTGLPRRDGAVCPECGRGLRERSDLPWLPACRACGTTLEGLDEAVTGQTCPACGADESQFGNWKRARVMRQQAAAERATRAQRRSTR